MPVATSPSATATGDRIFSFPNPVNEVAARLVALGVVVMATAALLLDLRWMALILAYGFVARVLAGPTLSPLGLLVTEVVVPRLSAPPRLVAGPPKRFAQGIGATCTVLAAVLTYGFDRWGAGQALIGAVVVAASLEAFLGFCVGCRAFALLMRAGVVPADVCERCNDIWATPSATGPTDRN